MGKKDKPPAKAYELCGKTVLVSPAKRKCSRIKGHSGPCV